ncbi:MAG: hypothetical protein ACI8V2_004999 [Candidatus Latescibacterota bacterium]|jgi:hypothetical protein
MNQMDLAGIVRAQSQQIRILQEQMVFVRNEITKTQVQTNRSIRHLAHLVRNLQAGNRL